MQNMRPIITHRRHHTRQRKKTISASCALYILHSCWALHIWHSCPPSYFLAFVIEPMSVLTTSSVLHGFYSSPSLCTIVERTSNHLKYPQPLFPYNTKYILLKRLHVINTKHSIYNVINNLFRLKMTPKLVHRIFLRLWHF